MINRIILDVHFLYFPIVTGIQIENLLCNFKIFFDNFFQKECYDQVFNVLVKSCVSDLIKLCKFFTNYFMLNHFESVCQLTN